MREAALPRIKVDCRHPLARLQQRDRDMHGGGGLSRATFLVADDDNVSRIFSFGLPFSGVGFEQHLCLRRRHLLLRTNAGQEFSPAAFFTVAARMLKDKHNARWH